MNSKIDQLDLKNGVKDVIKNVGKNFGKIQEITNSKSNNDESKFAGIVWENKESSNLDNNSQNKELEDRVSLSNKAIDTGHNEKSLQVIEIEIDALQRTTVFSNKVSMWIS
jgi:GH43 family beta-xylosidase